MKEVIYKTSIQFFETNGQLLVTFMSPKTGRFVKLDNSQIGKLDPTLAMKIRLYWESHKPSGRPWIGVKNKAVSRVFKLPMTVAELQDVWRVYSIPKD